MSSRISGQPPIQTSQQPNRSPLGEIPNNPLMRVYLPLQGNPNMRRVQECFSCVGFRNRPVPAGTSFLNISLVASNDQHQQDLINRLNLDIQSKNKDIQRKDAVIKEQGNRVEVANAHIRAQKVCIEEYKGYAEKLLEKIKEQRETFKQAKKLLEKGKGHIGYLREERDGLETEIGDLDEQVKDLKRHLREERDDLETEIGDLDEQVEDLKHLLGGIEETDNAILKNKQYLIRQGIRIKRGEEFLSKLYQVIEEKKTLLSKLDQAIEERKESLSKRKVRDDDHDRPFAKRRRLNDSEPKVPG